MKKIRTLCAALAFLAIPGCASQDVQNALNVAADLTVISKSELRKHWTLVCFDPADKMVKRTADQIDTVNAARDQVLGAEDCPMK